LLLEADEPLALLVLAHGAGAGMQHVFMEEMAERLRARGLSTLRYAFPYMARGRRAPDRPPVLQAAVRAAVARAEEVAGDTPLLLGGKSMGGRMSSMTLAEHPTESVRGIVFFGFPLHAAGKPSTGRADHLEKVQAPMLFLQGTRDKLAELELLTPICQGLGARARLHVVEGADHSFHVLKRSGRTDAEVLDELADESRAFARGVC
jgi:predicted alpha/beta-hydrolase family hydrolase